MNISSAIVHVVPARLDEACAALAAMPGVEIHARSPLGKVVVTLYTHKIGGLHTNDFIMAAKTDRAFSSK